MMWLNTKGFTLVEIMIVVAIIGLLAAIAVPNFVRARTTARLNACRNNMRIVAGAIEQWALETNQADTAAVSLNSAGWDVYIKGGLPTCPAGAAAYTYGLDTVADYTVTCGTHGAL